MPGDASNNNYNKQTIKWSCSMKIFSLTVGSYLSLVTPFRFNLSGFLQKGASMTTASK